MGNPFEALRSVRPERFVKPARVALGVLAATATLNFSDGRVSNATAQPEDSPNLNTSNFSLNEEQYCTQADSAQGVFISSLTYVLNKETGEYSYWPNGCPPTDKYLIIRSQSFVANVQVNTSITSNQGR